MHLTCLFLPLRVLKYNLRGACLKLRAPLVAMEGIEEKKSKKILFNILKFNLN